MHPQPTPEMTRSFKPFTECFFFLFHWFTRLLAQVTVRLNIYVRSPFARYTPLLNQPIFSDLRQLQNLINIIFSISFLFAYAVSSVSSFLPIPIFLQCGTTYNMCISETPGSGLGVSLTIPTTFLFNSATQICPPSDKLNFVFNLDFCQLLKKFNQ